MPQQRKPSNVMVPTEDGKMVPYDDPEEGLDALNQVWQLPPEEAFRHWLTTVDPKQIPAYDHQADVAKQVQELEAAEKKDQTVKRRAPKIIDKMRLP